ncbi:MAG: hypothetical protein MJ217_01290 [Bacilli bacterium]|nr:hypothetical protein [Bacilli bacterium]
MENKEIKKVERKTTLDVVISFLLVEVLIIVSFNLTGNIILFSSLMLAVLALLVFLTIKQLKFDGISSFLLFLIPLFAYGLLSVLSHFADDPMSAINPIPNKIFAVIGLLSFASVGFLSNYTKGFNIKTALWGVYSALALYVAINLLITLVQFSPFYTITHANYYFYYEGEMSSLSLGEMAYCLVGFTSTETSLSYFSLFASILSTALVALFFINPKEDRKTFELYAVCGGIGLLALILTPCKMSFLTDFGLLVTCTILILVKKIKWNEKSKKLVGNIALVLIAIVAVLFIIFVLNAQEEIGFLAPLQNLIRNNGLLNRLFNTNGLSTKYKLVISHLFNSGLMFGFQPGYYAINGEEVGLFTSGSALFDVYMVSGLFGLIFLVIFLTAAIKRLIKYFNKSTDAEYVKVLIASYILVFLTYVILNYDSMPFAFKDETMPMYMLTPFLICLFFIGYTYSNKKEELVNENN